MDALTEDLLRFFAWYLVSVGVMLAFVIWFSRRPAGQGLPFAALVAMVLIGPFSLVFLVFWYFVHRPYRDALGPPPSP